uniref:SH2B adaptor protein 2 n=1 Tax=Salmo trutta TaxID=8032 RepID=A0A673WI17_SALTR
MTQSSKPKLSVPLTAVMEVRTTMPLEMPDRDNTFVLKVENGGEYILETLDSLQKHSWVADIQDCIDPGNNQTHIPKTPQHRAGPCGPSGPRFRTLLASPLHPTHVPLERFLQSLESNRPGAGNGQLSMWKGWKGCFLLRQYCDKRLLCFSPVGEGTPHSEMDTSLTCYPWFHGTLSRVSAAQLVLVGGARSHGLFVIRQSETRLGEYVLTFNFQGKAKHLRLSVDSQGQCHVHHLWFQSVGDMLQHFHCHPIPLESRGAADVTLRCYVQTQRSRKGEAKETKGTFSCPNPLFSVPPSVGLPSLLSAALSSLTCSKCGQSSHCGQYSIVILE